MSRLLFIPRPLPEESPTSLFKRLAFRHGCVYRTDLRDLFGTAYPTGSIIYRNHAVVQQVADLITEPEDKEAFLNGFYATEVNFTGRPTANICGMQLDTFMVRIQGAAFCSDCWQDGCDRFVKDLRLAIYCPYHARKYLDRCPVCGHSLAWPDLLSRKCDCPALPESERCTDSEMELERRLLTYFNLHDAQGLAAFQKYLVMLGYRNSDSSYCPATRAWALLACALADCDDESILRHLSTLELFYPQIPKRILCAKLAMISTPQSMSNILNFLRRAASRPAAPAEYEERPLLSEFCLSKSQLRAWQSIRFLENRALHQLHDLQRSPRIDWQQASTIAESLLDLRLKNTLERKPQAIGYTVKEVQKILVLTVAAIKGAVSEKLLTPIEQKRKQWYFTDEDLKNFSTKYVSIQRVANESGYSVKQIRKSLQYFANQFADQGDDLTDPSARLRIISVQRRDTLLKWLNRSIKIPRYKVRPHYPLPHLTGDEAGVWMSVFDAARQLSVHPTVVKSLIRVGLLPCSFRLQRGNGYALSQGALDEFANRYIGVSEAMVVLQCNQNTTTKLLKKMSILPVTGPGVDTTNSHYFSRSEVDQLARDLKTPNIEQKDCYTIMEASKELRISVSSAAFLIRQGVLDSPDLIHKQYMLVKKSSVCEFSKSYITLSDLARSLTIPIHCIRHLLSGGNISAVGPDRLLPSPRDVYRKSDVSLIFPGFENPKPKSNLIAIRILLSKYHITAKNFFRLFIGSGFIKPIGPPRAQTHVTESDAKKVSTILDEYLTFPQADQYLGHKGECRNLVLVKKLAFELPMTPYNNCRFFKKDLIIEYISLRESLS